MNTTERRLLILRRHMGKVDLSNLEVTCFARDQRFHVSRPIEVVEFIIQLKSKFKSSSGYISHRVSLLEAL